MAAPDTPRTAKLRQDRAHRTRAALLEAAASLWADRGYDDVSVSDIAARAGVAKGSFFYYFPTKEHLLLELVAAGDVEELTALVDERLADGDTLLEVLASVVRAVAEGQRYAPRALVGRAAMEVLRGARRARAASGGSELRDVYARAYAAAMDRGELPRTFHPVELGAMTNWVVLQGILFWALDVVGPLTLEDVLWRRVQLVVQGASLTSLTPLPRRPDPSGPRP